MIIVPTGLALHAYKPLHLAVKTGQPRYGSIEINELVITKYLQR
jgi:hypothetical protein